ncbi:MAG: NUDIX hydrolase [Pyrinomonadaceae bacterium]
MTETVETWKIKSSKEVADCRVFKVREDFCERTSDKMESSFFVCENPDWVNIIALTKNNEVILIEQFRHGIKEIILEVPGGMIDGDEEKPETAARRELLEETGFSADKFVLLGKSRPNPAIQNNTVFHYLALDCEKTEETSFDEHESVLTKIVSLEVAENLIENGVIAHSLVIAAFHYFSIYSRKEK